MRSPVVAKNSAQTASYLDVVGYNYMESRFGTGRRALSEPGDRGERDASRRRSTRGGRRSAVIPTSSATSPGPGGTTSARSGSGARSTASRMTRRACRRSWASIRGAPRGAGTSTSRVTAAPSPTTERSSSGCVRIPTSRCSGPSTTGRSPPGRRGPGPTSCRPGAGPDTRGRRRRWRSTPTPTRSSWWSTAARSAASPAAPTHRYRSAVRDHVRTRRARGGRLPGRDRESAGRPSGRLRGRCCWTAAVDRAAIAADPEDLAFVTLQLVDGDGVLHVARDRTVEVEVEGRRCSRPWAAPTRPARRASPGRAAPPSTAAPWPSSGRRVRGGSPCGPRPRAARRSG